MLDRRWDDVKSLEALASQPGDWVVRGAKRGPHSFVPLNKAQRNRLRGQRRGDKPWSRKQLVQLLWTPSLPVPGRKNTFAASVRAKPFQGSPFECTVVVAYAPRRGHRLQANERLDPRRNMSSTILLTNRLPGEETNAWALSAYARRWNIEVDIKEHKSYVNPGSGPRILMRVLKEQSAMILENLATYIRAYQARHGAKTFTRYQYNPILRAFAVYDAVRGGWSPKVAPSVAGPPLA